jgi:lauroyl/myristoyl acyltransferase
MGTAPAAAGRAHRHRFESPFWRRLVIAGVRAMPFALQRATMPLWAAIFFALVPSARRAVLGNLAQVLDEHRPLALCRHGYRVFINYAQSIANMYSLYFSRGLPVEPRFAGRDRLVAARALGRGTIVVTGHLGFWQLGPFLLERHGFGVPVMAMAEEPNARVQEFEQQLRSRFRIVYTTGSPFALLELASVLREGGTVAMHLDRHTGGASVILPFCGRLAAFPVGPATLARATGAPLVPVFMIREGATGFASLVEEPYQVPRTADRDADVRRATEHIVSIYESYVLRYPHQWFNFHDFWEPPSALGAPADASPPAVARGAE